MTKKETSPQPPYTFFKAGDLVEVTVTLPLRQTLTYRMPPEMAAAARIGMPVLVPVGRRWVLGYLLVLPGKFPTRPSKDVVSR